MDFQKFVSGGFSLWLCLLVSLLPGRGAEVTELVYWEEKGSAGLVRWSSVFPEVGGERASEDLIRSAYFHSHRVVNRDRIKEDAVPFRVVARGEVDPALKAGGLATALLACSWDAPSPRSSLAGEVVVCGSMEPNGWLRATEPAKKAIADFAINPIAGVSVLIIPEECAPVVRNAVAAGNMTFVTRCVVWTVVDIVDIRPLLTGWGKIKPAVAEYIKQASRTVKGPDWQLQRGPAIKLLEALDSGDLVGFRLAQKDRPNCLTLRLYCAPPGNGRLDEVLSRPSVIERINKATAELAGWGIEYSILRAGSRWHLRDSLSVDSHLSSTAVVPVSALAGFQYDSSRGIQALVRRDTGMVFLKDGIDSLPLIKCPLEYQRITLMTALEEAGLFDNGEGVLDRYKIPPPGNFLKDPPPERRPGQAAPNMLANPRRADLVSAGYLSAEMSFLLWWEAFHLLRFPRAGYNLKDQPRWLAREAQYLQSAKTTYSEGRWWDVILNRQVKGIPDGERLLFNSHAFPDFNPELLATFARGTVGAILRVTEIIPKKEPLEHFLPVISASGDGNFVFCYAGAIYNGRLYRLTGVKPGESPQWGIELSGKEAESSRSAFKGELRLYLPCENSYNADGLRIFWLDSAPGKVIAPEAVKSGLR